MLKELKCRVSGGSIVKLLVFHRGFYNNNNNNNNNFTFDPKIYKKEKFIIIVQTMIGALAARNNLRVKNARQPVERKDV